MRLGGCSRPRMARAKVDLPQPLGPTSAPICPAPRTGRRHRTARSRLGHGPARRAAARSRARAQAPGLASTSAIQPIVPINIANAAAGRTASHQSPPRRKSVPARTMPPSAGCVGDSPAPKKESVASANTAWPSCRTASAPRAGAIWAGHGWRGSGAPAAASAGPPGRRAIGTRRGRAPGPCGHRAPSPRHRGPRRRRACRHARSIRSGWWSAGARPGPALSAPGGATARRPRRASPARSDRPPAWPAQSPRRLPAVSDRATTVALTSTDRRRPKRIDERMQRPWASVPKGNCGLAPSIHRGAAAGRSLGRARPGPSGPEEPEAAPWRSRPRWRENAAGSQARPAGYRPAASRSHPRRSSLANARSTTALMTTNTAPI